MSDQTSFDDYDIFKGKKLNDIETDEKESKIESEVESNNEIIDAEPNVSSAEPILIDEESDENHGETTASIDCAELYIMIEKNNNNINTYSSKLDSLAQNINEVKQQLTRLAAYDTAVDTLKRSLAANQASENNLYREVEAYKKGMYFTNIKPFLMFMIEMLCELKASKAQYTEDRDSFIKENSEAIYEEICGLHDFYIDSIGNQLKFQGVQIVSFESGTEYVPIQQHIAKTIATNDSALNSMIAKIYCDCYMYGDKILKPAKVHIYKYVSS